MSENSILTLAKLFLKLDWNKLDKNLLGHRKALDENNICEVEIELRKHIEQNPFDEVALCELALIEKRNGKSEEAIELFKRAIDAHASYPHSRYLLVCFYLELRD